MDAPVLSFLARGNINDIQRCYNRPDLEVCAFDDWLDIVDSQRSPRMVTPVGGLMQSLHDIKTSFVEIADNQRSRGTMDA